MKSKTSSFKSTVTRKNLSRFAPAWVLYGVFLLMCLLLTRNDGQIYWLLVDMKDFMQLMSIGNLFYAALCAQLLFGDLYNSRMCNALHALPIRRGSWFRLHITSGLLFSLLPNLVCAGVSMLLLGQYWFVGLVWLGTVSLQFICCFGIAVFAAFCAGNRFAMIVIYGIIHFFAVILYWMLDYLYEPLLYGIHWNLEGFIWFCPIAAMLSNLNYLDIHRYYDDNTNEHIIQQIRISDGWQWLVIYAAVGLVMLILAGILYRRRKLEVAGDFIALRPLAPVFLILYTLCFGVACQVFTQLFGYDDPFYIFLAVGIVVGFFTGRMLLKRTVRVFQGRAFLGALLLGLVLAISLLLTWLDPIGITRWLPQPQDVRSVTVYNAYDSYSNEHNVTLEAPEDIQNIIDIHSRLLTQKNTPDFLPPAVQTLPDKALSTLPENTTVFSTAYGSNMDLTLVYALQDGKTVRRHYEVFSLSDEGLLLQTYFSSPECVLGIKETDIATLVSQLENISTHEIQLPREQWHGLIEAIVLDCKAGTIAQPWEYHDHEDTQYWLDFVFPEESMRKNTGFSVRVYTSCENTYRWLREHGILTENEYYAKEY